MSKTTNKVQHNLSHTQISHIYLTQFNWVQGRVTDAHAHKAAAERDEGLLDDICNICSIPLFFVFPGPLLLDAASLCINHSPGVLQGITCLMEMQSINPHLVYLYSDDTCALGREDYVVGLLARASASFGLGVISAAVGSEGRGWVSAAVGSEGRGWIIALFETITTNINADVLEWTFLNGSCWFKLQEQLGFNQSSLVCHLVTFLSGCLN